MIELSQEEQDLVLLLRKSREDSKLGHHGAFLTLVHSDRPWPEMGNQLMADMTEIGMCGSEQLLMRLFRDHGSIVGVSYSFNMLTP